MTKTLSQAQVEQVVFRAVILNLDMFTIKAIFQDTLIVEEMIGKGLIKVDYNGDTSASPPTFTMTVKGSVQFSNHKNEKWTK